MADVGMADRLQRLFEELSDDYVGTVEQDRLTPEHLDVTFIGEDGVVRARSRLSLCNYTVNNYDDGGYLVRCVDPETGEECYVSYLPSAIIAVACR